MKEWDGEGMSEFPTVTKPEWPKTIKLVQTIEMTLLDEKDFKEWVAEAVACYGGEEHRLQFDTDYNELEGRSNIKLPIDNFEDAMRLIKYDIDRREQSVEDIFEDHPTNEWTVT